MDGWNSNTMKCVCHNQDCCPDYEFWCSDQESKEWWESLTEEEKDSYSLKLCNNCMHAFVPTDDDGEQEVCIDCIDYLDDPDYGISF